MAINKVFTRSPYFVTVSGALNDNVRLDLYIWNDPSSSPLTPTRVLSKPIVTGTEVSFNVSQYLRQYINPKPLAEAASPTPNADYDMYCKFYAEIFINDVYDSNTGTLRCLDGYGMFENGMNPNLGDLFLAEGTYYYYSGSLGSNGTLSLGAGANWYVKYIETGTLDETILSLGSTVGFKTIERTNYTTLGNKLEVYDDSDVLQAEYYFLPMDECKYEPVALDFINKFGVPQREIFWKASYKKFDVKSTPFKAMPSSVDYDTSKAIDKIMNVNGSETVKVNTGWVDENYAYTIQEILLSEVMNLAEYVYSTPYPCKIKTNSIEMHKHINQKLINYTLEFEYAFDKLNNVI
jgi:hypothetical protein